MILDKTYIFINVVSWGVILQVKKKGADFENGNWRDISQRLGVGVVLTGCNVNGERVYAFIGLGIDRTINTGCRTTKCERRLKQPKKNTFFT